MSVPVIHESDVEALNLPGRQLSWVVSPDGLPAESCSACMIRVAPGDKVRGGSTVIARWSPAP